MTIIAIAPSGTGQIRIEEFRTAADEATALNDFINAYSPALDAADYVAHDPGFGSSAPDPDAGKAYFLDHDATPVALVQKFVSIRGPLKAAVMPVAPPAPLVGNVTVTDSALQITTVINGLITSDITNVVADATDTKQILISCVYNRTSDSFAVLARERKTTTSPPEAYAALASDEVLADDLKEYSLVANGTSLTVV